MKKYILILFVTSLLLSSCSLNLGSQKSDFVKKSLSEKKRECERYSDEATTYYKNNDWWISIFYSEKLDTCVVNFIWMPDDSKDGIKPATKKYIFDYLTKKSILETEDGIVWTKKIKEIR